MRIMKQNFSKMLLLLIIVFAMALSITPADVLASDPNNITILINNGSQVGGGTLEEVITTVGTATDAVNDLKITAGKVTEADWTYIKEKLTNLLRFEIADTILDDEVADIPGYCFAYSDVITEIVVPQAIVIGANAFEESSIKTAEFSRATSIGDHAFRNCANLLTANIPDATSIGDYAFDACTSLEAANFPKVVTIGTQAFASCLSFGDIDFPSLENIASLAFASCTDLVTVEFPKVTSIDASAFQNCTNLETADFPVAESIGVSAFASCSKLENIKFPMVTSIGERAFVGNNGLLAAGFPKVKDIAKYAFSMCENLVTVSLPNVEKIDSYAFQNCKKLTTLNLPATPPAVADKAFFSPTTGSLGFVDANGEPLTGAALAAAVKNYMDAQDGDGKWYGWTISTVTGKVLSKIEVTTQPTKTTYTVGEKFDKAGMTVAASYSDGSKTPITDYSITPDRALTTSDGKITVSYTKGDITKTAEVIIKVNAAVGGGSNITTEDNNVPVINKTNSPKTGDTSNAMLYISLLVISCGAAGFGLKKKGILK